MGLPSKLKDFNLFNDGQSYMGQVPELTLPKLTRKMEEYRASGMSGPVMVDYGNEAITLEWTAAGLLIDALKQYGAHSHHAVQLRFAGAFQNDDTGEVSAMEVVVRGRHKEIDMGSAKHATDTAHKYSTSCSYYKLTVDGEVLIELDFMGGTEQIGGKDRQRSIRQAIGL
ncbi:MULTISPECIES: phage major tail tube protein [unclassified Undibacterium]|uniref:phage major tail tube protein n=1 Tax=unclassified Undibacterium TaxID=2630295 RepID=UPI002AC97D7E|nr:MULTISPECIES: phage major tail tube protein [unclassified Undibacterium]MEB0137986.1 phage major tail tube protein [Undibacterium sp. CCC2.1]MEB0170681.1 phage major tail tube protein [Undibacterium sp. CCC1.1]MEB0177022.1 phage major tail tube protein [Undibacterium sp. CCC3.4]MEB0216311.1 phage major tail tube protein [Undibacterium sp. 5I2]WPX42495.1 phage major tail tube protein [Undibacterium sp. CCC3.4]